MSEEKFWVKTGRKGALSDNDPNSFSNPECIRPESMHIIWKVDFERKNLEGSVRYELRRATDSPDLTTVIFDTLGLHLKSVKGEDGTEFTFSVGEAVETFGSPLKINLPNTDWTRLTIVIEYETTSNSTALMWLAKEQTAGKDFPYLFSKCSAIQARSLLPCQDTPSVKVPYTANVSAPQELTVLMGAVRQNDGDDLVITNDYKIHRFVQEVPIPSYLIALIVGKLESRRLGPKTLVWAESDIIEAAASQFEDTNKVLMAEEKLFGEYVWKVYDLVVLPPSYPAGGMENPCLTFLTPTLIGGDKSSIHVVAHEIAHSWSGNLVTNRTFEHFWLNEGITMYLERRVLGVLEGEQFRHFLGIGGLKQLKEAIRSMGSDNPMTSLVPNLAGVNPMHSFSLIPYEKGFLFLYYLEQTVGGQDIFGEFLKKYIWENAYKSVDTNTFKSMFINFFNDAGKASEIEKIDWDTWLYAPGLPDFEPQYDHTLVDVATELKTKWMNWDPNANLCPFRAKDFDAFALGQSQVWEFLAQLHEEPECLGLKKIEALDEKYCLSTVQNNEIKFLWIKLCIKEKYVKIVPLAIEFITAQGRIKFIKPIYNALHAWQETKLLAVETFQKNRPNMMPNSVTVISKDLHLKK